MTSVLHTLRTTWRSWWSPYFNDSDDSSWWAGFAVTFLFNSAIAAVLTLWAWAFSRQLDLGKALWWNFVIAQCIGFSIHLLFMLFGALFGAARIDAWRGLKRVAFFSVIPLLGVLVGYLLGFTLLGVDVLGRVRTTPKILAGVLLIWAVLTFFWWRFYAHKLKLAETEKLLAADRARAAQLEATAVDAQLRGLQAQIEPHFLFNTLANVVSLIDTRPADARHMLERLIELLRASLDASRSARATVAQEFGLLRAYLDILSIRMGARLHYEIDAPSEVRALPLPPLLVQPIVENAIRHGLEPKLDGGAVRVTARRLDAADGAALQIEVIDDGVGFGATTAGDGVGLANLRERIATMFGNRARLTIEDATPGTRVRLVLPLAAGS